MSERGIVLRGDVFKARPSEPRYTINEAVDYLNEHGYVVTSRPHVEPMSGPGLLVAQLKTRCGCTRDMFLPERQPDIRVPIYAPARAFVTDPVYQIAKCRTFDYTRWERRADGMRVAYYEEKFEK